MRLTFVGATGLGLLLCLPGCHAKTSKVDPPKLAPIPPRGIVSIEEGDIAFADGQWTTADQRYQECLQLGSSCSRPDYALFQRSVIHGLRGTSLFDPASSIVWLNELVKKYPTSPMKAAAEFILSLNDDNAMLAALRDKANEQIQDLRAENQKLKTPPPKHPIDEARQAMVAADYVRAVTLFEEYLRQCPEGSQCDAALFDLGVIFGLQGYPRRNPDRSTLYFKQLLKDYPTSPYAAPAQTIIVQREQIALLSSDAEKQNQRIKQLNSELERLKTIDSQRPRRPSRK